MHHRILPLVLTASLLLPAMARADVGVTADLGTGGAGVHLLVPMESNLNGRFGVNERKHSYSGQSGGIDYDFQRSLKTADVLFDWYPTAKQWHVTAGIVYNGNEIKAKAKPGADGKYTIHGHSYAAADVANLTGIIDYRKAAPYLGLGWGNALATKKAWGFSANAGAIFQGKPNSKLVSIGCTISNTVCNGVTHDVALEKEQFAADATLRKILPVLQVSASYRF